MDGKKKKRRFSLWMLALLPLMFACVFFAAQAGLYFAKSSEVDAEILALETADYSLWNQHRFGPIDPSLLTLIASEGSATFLPRLPDEIAQEESTERTLQTTPSATPTPTTSPTPSTTTTQIITPTSLTRTETPSPTNTLPPTQTLFPTATASLTPSRTTTATTTPSRTSTVTASPTGTATNTLTPSHTPTSTYTFTPSHTPTNTPTSTLTLTPVPTADLALSMTVNTLTPLEGQTVTYTITINNLGANSANSIQVTDNLPAGLTFVLYSASQGTLIAGRWNVGTLANGATATLNLTARVGVGTAGTPITNNATITASSLADPNTGNNSASQTITSLSPANTSDLSLTMTASNPTPNVNSTFTYTVAVSNGGPAGATGVQVSVTLPPQVTYQSASGVGTYDSGTGVWTAGSVSTGGSISLNIIVRVNPATEGQIALASSTITALTQTDPESSDNSASVNITFRSAGLTLTKTVNDSTVIVGQNITYTVQVTNNMTIPATGVQVTDALPSGLTLISSAPDQGTYIGSLWDIGTIPAGTSVRLLINVSVDASAAGTSISNTASITALNEPDSNPADNSATRTITVYLEEVRLTKSVNDSTPIEGTNIVYTLRVTNYMPITATGIQVTDLLPAGVTFISASSAAYDSGTGLWNVGSLASGATDTLTMTAAVDTGTAGSRITNTTSITALDQPDPDPSNNTASATLTVQAADVILTKTVSSTTPSVGQQITYTIRVQNNLLTTATGVQVTDILPAEVIFVSASGTYDSGTGIWDVGSINSLASVSLNIVVTVDTSASGSTVTNTASMTALDQPDPDPSNNTDSVNITVPVAEAELAITKTASNPTPNEGQLVDYTIRVTNNGPSLTTGVEVWDGLPPEVTLISQTTSQGIYNPATGLWDIGTLANGASAQLNITVSVNSGTAGTTITNGADITVSDLPDPNPANNNVTVDIHVPGTDVEILKTVNDNAPDEGDTIVYTLTLINNGPDDAPASVQVSDVLPLGVTYISHAASQGTYNGSVWDVGGLPAGAAVTLDITATVDMGTSGGTITNTATITAFNIQDTNSSNNSDWSDVTVGTPEADLFLSKSVDNPTPDENSSIIYTVTVTNNGTDTATNVMVMDSLPSGVSYVFDLPSQGFYNAGTGEWNVGTLPVGSTASLQISAVTSVGIGGMTIVNTAGVSFLNELDPDLSDNTDSASIDVQFPPSADLSLSLFSPNTTPFEGDYLVYEIALTNNGVDTATNVSISSPIPAGLTYDSASPETGSYAGDTWFIGTINPAETWRLYIGVYVNTAGTAIPVSASITAADQPDPDSGNNSAGFNLDVQASADLSLSISADNTAPLEGDTVTYTLMLTNNGPNDAVGVQVTDVLPVGMTFTGTSGSYDSGSGIWDVGNVSVGATPILTVSAQVNVGTTGQTLTNTASISTAGQVDFNSGNDSASVDITVQ